MVSIPVYTAAGKQSGEIELAADVFGLEPNVALMHQAVVTTLANHRQGTADTKTRGEVHHSTKKVYRQKGTGRARQGMKSAPHWKGGGIVFGPHPRDFGLSLPKKMRRKALLCALSSRVADGAVKVVDEIAFTKPHTQDAVAMLKALDIFEPEKIGILLVLDQPTDAVIKSFRNLGNVLIVTIDEVGTYETLKADVLLFTKSSIEALQALKQQPVGSAYWLAKQQEVADE